MTNCHQLNPRATDGKMRLTDVADTEHIIHPIAKGGAFQAMDGSGGKYKDRPVIGYGAVK